METDEKPQVRSPILSVKLLFRIERSVLSSLFSVFKNVQCTSKALDFELFF